MSKQFLKDYINAYWPVAQEWEGQKIWADYVKQHVDYVKSDNYGTVFGVVKSKVQNELEHIHNGKQVGNLFPKEYKRYKVVLNYVYIRQF